MKTSKTKELENKIYKATRKIGVFGCFEVTIGFYGHERVDYMTYDVHGIWRCYEIKVSKSDFYNKKSKITFIGHYNYYVMPIELYEEVKNDIPEHIGVHCGDYVIKNPKKQELKVDVDILKDSFIRSLSREAEKSIVNRDKNKIERYKKEIKAKEIEIERYRGLYYEALDKIYRNSKKDK